VFYEIEARLVPVSSIWNTRHKVDAAPRGFCQYNVKRLINWRKTICRMVHNFNLNSRAVGQILFDVLKICESQRRPGPANSHRRANARRPAQTTRIVQRLLEHRTASKLKSTYADALPGHWKNGRVHTTIISDDNDCRSTRRTQFAEIPIRSERGQEIRKPRPRAGVPIVIGRTIPIELRSSLVEPRTGIARGFRAGIDVHTATRRRSITFSLMVTPRCGAKPKW